MSQRPDRPYLSRPEVSDPLTAAWTASAEGPQRVLLDGKRGSGRRTAVGQLGQSLVEAGEKFCLVRIPFEAADDGVRSLMRVYGAFIASMGRGAGFDNPPADLLEAAAGNSEDERVSSWLSMMGKNIGAMSDKQAGGDFRVDLPRENPYMGLLYALDVVTPGARWIIELSNVGNCTSPAFWTFLAAFQGRATARNWKILFIASPGSNIYGEGPTEASPQPGPQAFLSSLFEGASLVSVPDWSIEQTAEFLADCYGAGSFPAEFPARIHSISGGEAALLHDVLDALEEDESITESEGSYSLSSLDDVDAEVLVPMVLEQDEEADPAPEGTEELYEKILHVASFEGPIFSASAIRSVLGADEDTIDDALDAMEHIVEEAEYHQGLGTWTYRFRHPIYRRWYREHPPEAFAGKAESIGRALGTVMLQAYAPAAFEYVNRAAALLSEAGDSNGARNLLGMAMGSERIELMDFALEITRRFDDSLWPPLLERFLYANLADRFANGASTEEAEKRLTLFKDWAIRVEDTASVAYTHLLRCRLQIRQGEFAAAKTAAEAALGSFEAAGETTRIGETLNQLAMICLNQNDPKGAEVYVKRAQKATTRPAVKAHSQYILGLLLKRAGQISQAGTCFAGATKLATEGGQLGLALEAMLNQGECGIMLGKAQELAPMLERALEMSRAMRSPARERVAARLLCQSEAARGRAEAAFEMARHALELTRDLEPQGDAAVDLYHCGLFAVLSNKPEEGLDFLGDARKAAEQTDNQPLLSEILFNLGQVKISTEDWAAARGALEQSLAIVRDHKQKPREVRILEALGIALSGAGDHRAAVQKFEEASKKAIGPQAKDFRRGLRKRIAQEQSRAARA
jgi:tetratricopeptide (TPR) repeat protein